ncbi:MAG TPA: hypothetical protein DDX47_01670 [Candidatus Jacksonbacteria bacterium]|nr:MAG: hypothetical protein A2240_01315 [Candidatus Jacksonbacteria bacterium RIFOXYA2_FULL_43_12]OGY81834.1 MAG: hypothetical protein A2550_03640 [Candidatus Jacksonbacteria bacterium RIFOXYD2_FULL_43_21]HBH46056.1 hypothetical protein [Candidatus Jacksonbacteria bacterium]
MIEKLKNPEAALAVFNKLYVSNDPFSNAAHTGMPIRAVIYPTYGYLLNERQFESVAQASMAINGKNTFYVAQVEVAYPNNSFIDNLFWLGENSTYDEYFSLPLNLEAMTCAIDATWGFLTSQEDHALLVCTKEFWQEFSKYYPSWPEDYNKFVQYWNEQDAKRRERWFESFLAGLTVKP